VAPADPDIQVIGPAQQRRLDLENRGNLDPAVVLGFRLQLIL
jgi:hypothetical protein